VMGIQLPCSRSSSLMPLFVDMCMHHGSPIPCMHILGLLTHPHTPQHTTLHPLTTTTIDTSITTPKLASQRSQLWKKNQKYQVSLVRTHQPITQSPITSAQEAFADFCSAVRLCPMLNGTWKPEDRPDGQGDSSFGAVPAALTL
jgi:hypothetical protein